MQWKFETIYQNRNKNCRGTKMIANQLILKFLWPRLFKLQLRMIIFVNSN